MLKDYFEGEIIEKRCDVATCPGEFSVKIPVVTKYPNTLIIILKRFGYSFLTSRSCKNKIFVNYPIYGLNVASLNSKDNKAKIFYDLSSVIVCNFFSFVVFIVLCLLQKLYNSCY